jgi:tRNA C32,U32 (ribose-2'-O)-methylase TrmJ
VQILTYELRESAGVDEKQSAGSEVAPASAAVMEHFFEHLERVLTDIRFLDPGNPRYLMRRMRRLFNRARPDENEANILRGMLSAIDRTRRTHK